MTFYRSGFVFLMYHCFFLFQVAEEVNFAANGITTEGIKAFDGILHSKIESAVVIASDYTVEKCGTRVGKFISLFYVGRS